VWKRSARHNRAVTPTVWTAASAAVTTINTDH